MRKQSKDDLSPRERASWATLPDAVDPGPALEERTVSLLRRHGVLHQTISSGPARRRSFLWVAAGAAVFASGLVTGLTLRRLPPEPSTDPAVRIQRAGTEYVEALSGLSGALSPDSPAGEVALTTFAGAARELGRYAGPAALAAQLREATDPAPADSARVVLWF